MYLNIKVFIIFYWAKYQNIHVPQYTHQNNQVSEVTFSYVPRIYNLNMQLYSNS